MGNTQSENFSDYANKDILNYKGINSSISSSNNLKKNRKKFSSNESSENYEENNQIKNIKIPFLFEWKEGGKTVKITGNFVNWKEFFNMKEVEKGIFKYEVNLPKTKIQFKFIVDDKWVFSNNYNKIDDGNYNINNYIDLTHFKSKKKKKENKVNKGKKEIWCVNKAKDQMNINAPKVPFYYQDIFRINLNSNQIIIGRKKYLNFNYNKINDENNSYKQILYPPHINFSHIIIGCIGNKKYIKIGSYFRFKKKAITLIYYKPIKRKKN